MVWWRKTTTAATCPRYATDIPNHVHWIGSLPSMDYLPWSAVDDDDDDINGRPTGCLLSVAMVSRESRVDLNPPKRGVEFNLNPPKKLPISSRQSKETISIIDFCDTWISPLRLDRLAVVSCIFHHTVTSCLLPSSLPRIHPSHSIRWSGTKCYLIMCWSVQSEILVVGVARTSRSSEPSPLRTSRCSSIKTPSNTDPRVRIIMLAGWRCHLSLQSSSRTSYPRPVIIALSIYSKAESKGAGEGSEQASRYCSS